ncbi:hypothetical protein P9112_012819 [Eukaryota sp. TZLM1-RC]
MYTLGEELNLDIELIPARATDLFCVLDVSINAPFKKRLRKRFGEYCTEDITKQLQNNVALDDVRLNLLATTVKPKIGQWIIDSFEHLKANMENYILNEWEHVRKDIDACIQALE